MSPNIAPILCLFSRAYVTGPSLRLGTGSRRPVVPCPAHVPSRTSLYNNPFGILLTHSSTQHVQQVQHIHFSVEQISHLHRAHQFVCSAWAPSFCSTALTRPPNIWNCWQAPKDCEFQPNIISSKDGISGKAGSITALQTLSQPILSELKSPTHSLGNQFPLQQKTSPFWLLLSNFIQRRRVIQSFFPPPSPAWVRALCFS